jgi:hypothetical protein
MLNQSHFFLIKFCNCHFQKFTVLQEEFPNGMMNMPLQEVPGSP